MAEERDKQSSGNMRSLAETPYQVHSEQRGQSSGIQRGTGADWFGPLNPLEPIAPDEVAGRTFDIPSGYNLNIQPRAYEQVTFGQLRAFADGYDLLRLVIETRKDQMSKMNWNIVPRDPKKRKQGGSFAAEIQEIERFLLRPDGVNFWGDWLRTVLEDLLVLDAPSIYRRRTYGGQLYALEPIDGATIKRVIDDWGRTPNPPTPAYQQVLKGFPAIDYTTNDLIYRPRNQRTHKVYGFSPVEQIIMTVNIGIRRQVWQLQSFTEGNIPEALIGTPDNWTPDQIRSFQDWFDAMLEGNTGERRRARFVPGEISKGYIATKPSELFGAAEEWLARIVCYAFGISPQPFVAMMNRATAETAQEAAAQEGLTPIMQWVKNLVDTIIIDDFGNFDLEFQWNDEEELDPNVKSQIIDREVAAGLLTLNEGRAEKGLDPYDHPDADRPMFRAATGYSPILPTPEEQKQKEEAAAAISGKEAPSSEGSSPLSSGEGAPEEEEGEEEEEPAEKADKSGYKPPSGVRSAAKRGLELREKWGRGGIDNSEASAEGIGSGVQRATNLKNGDSISLATIKRMKSFFSRHQKNYNPDKKESDGGPTAGTIAWLLWGGNAGKAWVDSILSSEDKAEKSDDGDLVKAANQPRDQKGRFASTNSAGTTEFSDFQSANKYTKDHAVSNPGIDTYITDIGYRKMNADTKAGVKNDKVDEVVNSMTPLGSDHMVHRGVAGRVSLESGETFSSASLTSTSLSRDNALGFAGVGADGDMGYTLFTMRAKKGTKAVFANSGEAEMILPPGQKFKVVEVRKSPTIKMTSKSGRSRDVSVLNHYIVETVG